jgi:hypothetical protein
MNGTHSKIVGYDIVYDYRIDGKEFSNTEFVEPGPEIHKLYNRFSQGDSCFIEAIYMPENPGKSQLKGYY